MAGETLSYFFNYVTSDGSGFSDYAYARLLDADTLSQEALVFTARTQETGDIVPGFGLPDLSPGVVLNPATSQIIAGAPTWNELGSDSGTCFAAGCGYTGWIQATYTIQTTGSYRFDFGVVNWSDSSYDSGLAIAGLKIGGDDIIPPNPSVVPLPAGGLLMLSGLFGLAVTRRRKRA